MMTLLQAICLVVLLVAVMTLLYVIRYFKETKKVFGFKLM